jgi:trehalose 6-phosphate synthase
MRKSAAAEPGLAKSGPGSEQAVVAVANRLPVRHGDDGWELSPGGLVTALRPVMASHEGAWVGWDGGARGIPPALPGVGFRLLPIRLSAAQVRDYYHGFANATLWPLLHDAVEKPRFERAWWQSYRQVNAAFAEKALAALSKQPGALAWVHDCRRGSSPPTTRSPPACSSPRSSTG